MVVLPAADAMAVLPTGADVAILTTAAGAPAPVGYGALSPWGRTFAIFLRPLSRVC